MPPGDPFQITPETSQEIPMEIDEPQTFTEAEKYTKQFLQYQDEHLRADNQELRTNVIFWKNMAERLRSSGIPLHVNIRNKRKFDQKLVEDAQALDKFLDELITLKGVDSDLLATKLRILISGADSYDDFAKRMKELDFSLKCNEIWVNDSVAYRCNTCAMTPCMSLCAECFLSNGHFDHDFTRFFSREGGACDCGNEDVLSASGFCSRHGPEAMKIKRTEPPVALAEYIYLKIIVQIFLRLRGFERDYEQMVPRVFVHLQSARNKAVAPSISFLQKCVNMGGPMRNAMTRILTDKELYTYLTEGTSEDFFDEQKTAEGRQEQRGLCLNSRRSLLYHTDANLDWRTKKEFQRDLLATLDKKLIQAFEDQMHDPEEFMRCETLLHEFLFWIFRLKFPQNAINFILSMLSDPDYLNMVALRFFKWYPLSANIMKILCKRLADNSNQMPTNEVGSVASRIIHVSVQMLSSSALCYRMNEECDLVSTVFRSALFLLGEKSAPTECFLDPELNYVKNYTEIRAEIRAKIKGKVIIADKNAVISQHGYWFIMGDIQNVMSHTQLAVKTVCSPAFSVYLKLAKLMQGMNVYWRIVSGDHASHDNGDHAQRTFTMEYETLSITMFNFVMAILCEKDAEAAKQFFYGSAHFLKKWIKGIVVAENDSKVLDIRACPAYSFTVHLPLHRHLSIAISHFYEVEGFEPLVMALREETSFLQMIFLHPLRIHVFRAEHHCNMWVRNGHQLRIQSMLYAQPHINQSFLQPDLDLIRFCAANISAEWFISVLVQSYHLDDYFQIQPLNDDRNRPVVPEPMEVDELPSEYSLTSQEKLNPWKVIPEAEEVLKKALQDAGISFEMLVKSAGLQDEPSIKTILNFVVKFSKEADPPELPEPGVPSTSESNEVERAEEAEEWSRRKDIQEKLQVFSDSIKRNKSIKNVCRALKKVQEEENKIIDTGYSRVFRENIEGTRIGTSWNPEKSLILRRVEWIDPMVQNCFLLIAELLVIRVNCGATEREAMKMEMVHELANGKMKYSHIRQCITDKGSRNSSNEFFADVLSEVADYHEPDEDNDNRLSQGGYTLKSELWHSDFDPVFAQMRATLPGRAQEALIKAERYDLETYPSTARPASLWIPYRLYEPGQIRHKVVENIFDILFTDRFTQLALLTIETKRVGLPFLSDNTIQLIVYLLSIAAREGGVRSEPERILIYARFHKMYSVRMHGAEEPYDISLFQSVYRLFMAVAIRKGVVLEQLERVLSGSLFKERIIGGELEYLGRLLSILQVYDHTCRFPIEYDIESYKELKKEEEIKVDKESERKLAMKRKRDAILEKQRQKGAKLMEKLRENEGLSKDEVNAMDITSRQISSYECPICGDIDIPSTLRNPLGMMAVLVPNNLPELRVEQGWEPPTLMEAVEGEVSFPQHKRFSNLIEEKDITKMNLAIYSDQIQGPAMTAEIQTCGHTAHLECFKLFQQSQLDALRQDPTRGFLLSCPLCRTAIDTIIPLKIDVDYGTSDLGELEDDPARAFEEIKTCIMDWEKTFQDLTEKTNWHSHYSEHTNSWMEKMSPYNVTMRSKYDCQTILAGIMRAAVERSIIYREMQVPERRKNGWTMPIAQLIPAAVSRTNPRNVDVCLSALRDLFIPERAGITRSTSESALPLPPPPSGSLEMQDLLNLTADTASIERMARETERALVTKPGTVLNLPKDKKIEALLNNRSDVPLLLLDFRLLFIRIASFIVENEKLSNHDKLALIQALAKRIVQSGGIKTSILLLHRVTPALNNVLVNGEWFSLGYEPIFYDNPAWLFKHVCDWYNSSRHMLVAVQNSLISEEGIGSPLEVFDALRENIRSLDEFCQEFVFATGLVADRSDVHTYIDDFTECEEAAKHWIKWFALALNGTSCPPTAILHRTPLTWQTVTLLTPPYQYDELFSKLFKKKCHFCDKVPQTPFICMNCGQLVCFDDCCRVFSGTDRTYTMEINRHADSCTGRVGIYLALNSAVVVLVRGRYGAVWGSIYLDAHGEEDRNLRRGKALFLSKARFQILQKDWAAQTFDRVNAWYVSSMLHNLVREARL